MVAVALSAFVSLGLIVGLLAGMMFMVRQRLPQVKAAFAGVDALLPPSTPPAETNVVRAALRPMPVLTQRAA